MPMDVASITAFLLLFLSIAVVPCNSQDGAIVTRTSASDPWAPASRARATVQDLHHEYSRIFRHGNRNAASHRWATFLLARADQMEEDRIRLFFGGFCAVSGSPVRPSDFNRYRLTLPRLGGGRSTGYLHFCCWPCVCDTQDYIRVDTKNVTLANGLVRRFQFAVIGNPCDNPSQFTVPFVQPFDRRTTTISDSAREVRCLADGSLEGATLSDHGYVIIGLFFDAEEAVLHGEYEVAAGALDELVDPTPGRMSSVVHDGQGRRGKYHDEREYEPVCEERARNGYNSGMGEIFRRVSAVSPISDEALGLTNLLGAGDPSCELGADVYNENKHVALSAAGNR